jgi:hypothetical protein
MSNLLLQLVKANILGKLNLCGCLCLHDIGSHNLNLQKSEKYRNPEASNNIATCTSSNPKSYYEQARAFDTNNGVLLLLGNLAVGWGAGDVQNALEPYG